MSDDNNGMEKLSAGCKFTLALRVSHETLDFKAIDETLGVTGTHSRIDRSTRRFRPVPAFDQWELRAEVGESDVFTSLVEAFEAIGFRPAVGRAHIHVKAHWWCGCFHVTSPSTTVIPRDLLARLGVSGYPLHLDNYRLSDDSETASAEDAVDEMPTDDEFLGHRCRFRFDPGLARAALPAPGSALHEWSPPGEDFNLGLQAIINRVSSFEASRTGESEKGGRVICEHNQYAFDGGPTILGDAAASLELMGYDLHIEWTQR